MSTEHRVQGRGRGRPARAAWSRAEPFPGFRSAAAPEIDLIEGAGLDDIWGPVSSTLSVAVSPSRGTPRDALAHSQAGSVSPRAALAARSPAAPDRARSLSKVHQIPMHGAPRHPLGPENSSLGATRWAKPPEPSPLPGIPTGVGGASGAPSSGVCRAALPAPSDFSPLSFYFYPTLFLK